MGSCVMGQSDCFGTFNLPGWTMVFIHGTCNFRVSERPKWGSGESPFIQESGTQSRNPEVSFCCWLPISRVLGWPERKELGELPQHKLLS